MDNSCAVWTQKHETWLIFQSKLVKYSTTRTNERREWPSDWTTVDKIIVLEHRMIIRTVKLFYFEFTKFQSLFMLHVCLYVFRCLYETSNNMSMYIPHADFWYIFPTFAHIFFLEYWKGSKGKNCNMYEKKNDYKLCQIKQEKRKAERQRERGKKRKHSKTYIHTSCIQHHLVHLFAAHQISSTIFYKYKTHPDWTSKRL